MQTGARFPRTLLCPVAACPFTGHVLFTSLEALSLKRGQEPLARSEAAGGLGLRSGRGPGGLYGLGVWGFFARQFDGSFLSAAPLVEFAWSPREKCEVSPGGRSAPLRGAPVVRSNWLGWGAAAGEIPRSSWGIAFVGIPPCLVLVWEAAAKRRLTNTLAVISEGLAYGGSKAFL